MERQTRILLGDIGDQFAVNAAFAFRKAGDWAVTRRFNWHFGQMKDQRMTNFEFIAFTVDWIRTECSRKLCG